MTTAQDRIYLKAWLGHIAKYQYIIGNMPLTPLIYNK